MLMILAILRFTTRLLGVRYIRAEDDTYIAMDNMRSFLSVQNPNDVHYFGMLLYWPTDNCLASSVYARSSVYATRNGIRACCKWRRLEPCCHPADGSIPVLPNKIATTLLFFFLSNVEE